MKYSDRFLHYLVKNNVNIKVPNQHDAMSIGYLFQSPNKAVDRLIRVKRSSSGQGIDMTQVQSDLKSAYGTYKGGGKTTWPSGISYQENPGIQPLPGYAEYAKTAGSNRAGNAIPCQESSSWLFDRRMSPNFPLKRARNRFGKEGRDNIQLLNGISQAYYDHRGANGFQNLPKSIYKPDGGNVYFYNYNPYVAKSLGPDKYRYNESTLGSALPRPYGPRDNATMKGFPALPPAPTSQFGSDSDHSEYGPFVMQPYNKFGKGPGILPCIEGFGDSLPYGPFVLQGWATQTPSPMGSGFGGADSLFRPSPGINFGQVPQENPIHGLYLKGESPFDKSSAKQNQKIRAISNSYFTNMIGKYRRRKVRKNRKNAFGQMTGPSGAGPNRVGYENPMLMYPGAGANTMNYLTEMNYFPPCSNPGIRSSLKVQANNNPTGFLSANDVVPVSGLGFGKPKRPPALAKPVPGSPGASNPGPWVAQGTELGRPFTTQLMGTGNDGAGFVRVGQPLELYTYQNNNKIGYNYPQFLGPRAWYGGYGSTPSPKKLRLTDIHEGDVIHMGKNGNLAVQQNNPTKRQRCRKYYY